MMQIDQLKLNFVIADDDKDDQLLLLQAFTDNEVAFEATSVYSGSQLMDYLLSRNIYKNYDHPQPDFIFLDLNMPRQNGFEVLKEIKANTNLQDIPVYVLSTSCYPNDQSTAMGLGAKKFYTKPDEYDDIKKLVHEIIRLN